MRKISSTIYRKGGDDMIIFSEDPYDASRIKFYERKLGKDRLKLLEQSLRKVGNFESKKDIKIIDEEYKESYNTIYEVRDLDETSFKFYNFGLDYGKDTGRYKKNFYLMMQRKGSHLVYVYDFFSTETYEQKPEVIEINTQLSENRVLRVRNSGRHFSYFIIEENAKKYVLSLKEKAEEELLNNLERFIESFKRIEPLNLEEILKLIQMQEELLSASVSVDDDVKAFITFRNGKISTYEIKDSNKTINAKIRDTATRTVERTV